MLQTLTPFKASWYYASGSPDPNVHNLFTERNPKIHSEIRRKVANLYSMTTLLQLEPFVSEGTAHMVAKFEEFAHTGVKVNFQHFAQCWAFDVIGLITVRILLRNKFHTASTDEFESSSRNDLDFSTKVKTKVACLEHCMFICSTAPTWGSTRNGTPWSQNWNSFCPAQACPS